MKKFSIRLIIGVIGFCIIGCALAIALSHLALSEAFLISAVINGYYWSYKLIMSDIV